MSRPTLHDMFEQLRTASGQSHAGHTVEVFGWLILLEGAAILLQPDAVMSLLGGDSLGDQAANVFRLVGVLVGGVGMLYVVSGRLDAQGFIFASLLDRPLVPPLMALLWYLEILPGGLALAFAVQDFGSFLWTLSAWRAAQRSVP